MVKVFLRVFFFSLSLVVFVLFASPVFAAYEKFSPGAEVTISEFVYDDDFTPYTEDCTLFVYKPPNGDPFTSLPFDALGSVTMSKNDATGRHYKSFTPDNIPGVWPATISCGTPGVDKSILDKTFVVGYFGTSNDDIASSIWSYTGDALNTTSNAISKVWSYTGRSLDSISNIISGVWTDIVSAPNRFLTGGGLVTGNLVTETYLDDSLEPVISNQEAGWTVSLSDFGQTSAGEVYRAKLQVLNYKSMPTDPASAPVWTLYDGNHSEINPSEYVITRDSDGTYHVNYTIGSAVVGVCETEVSVGVEAGKTIRVNDYWEVEAPSPHVSVDYMTDTTISGSSTDSKVSAHITIINEGLHWYEYHYEWCVVTSSSNACGGDDDIFHGTESTRIEISPNNVYSVILDATDVLLAGEYYFKLMVYYGTEQSGASSSFIATIPAVATCGDNSCNGSETCSTCPADCGQCGGGGGGGGGGGAGGPLPTLVPTTCTGADFNHDKKVNSTDFSILLAFWKTAWPFRNPCVDINNDRQVNSVDFSILMYQWGTKK